MAVNRARVVYDLRELASSIAQFDPEDVQQEIEFFAYQVEVGVYDE